MSTFEVKGRALINTMAYVDKKVPGGRHTVLRDMAPADRSYLENELFIEGGWYDLFLYARLIARLAELSRTTVRELMCVQSARTADADVTGIYKLSLQVTTPDEMSERVHRAFNRYFRPCEASVLRVAAGQSSFEVVRVPRSLTDFFLGVNEGFVSGALKNAGAKRVSVAFAEPRPSERVGDVETVALRFDATYRT